MRLTLEACVFVDAKIIDGFIRLKVDNDGTVATVELLPNAAKTLAEFLSSAAVVAKHN